SVAPGMAGNTTAASPTMFWQSAEPRNLTHFQAFAWLSEPAQMESARPLYMLARWPTGPMGVGAIPVLIPLMDVKAPVFHDPSVTIAYLPAPNCWLVPAPTVFSSVGM